MKLVEQDLVTHFYSFMANLNGLESRYEEAISSLEAKKAKLDQKLKDLSSDESNLVKREAKLAVDEQDVKNQFELLKQDRVVFKSDLDGVRLREANLEKRHQVVTSDAEALVEKEQEILKREKLVGMEERRLKMFEHRLNLVAQDEKIKKALKDIE